MEHFKKKKITNIKDEVNEFHPLLNALFPRLPGITNVEYRQGPAEMGADFVLTKTDSTLDDIEYIGCIVKVGKIKQNHTEINRQIDECEIERKIEGGVRKIYLSEIWVISNDNITSGAQEKIHHNYKNKNIKFLTGEKIARLVEQYYPEHWTDFSVECGEYLRSVGAMAVAISNNNFLIDSSGTDIYIPQDLLEKKPRRSIVDRSYRKAKKVKVESVIKSNNYVIIEGMMGNGKSMLLSQIAQRYSDKDVFSEVKIAPVLLSASASIEKYEGNIENILNTIVPPEVAKEAGGFLILIDGLDELNVSDDARINYLNKIYDTSKQIENIKILITTRSIDDPEAEAEIERTYKRYELCSLSINQVVSLVDKICKKAEVKSRLVKDLDKSHLFKVLPKTPISAILLAKILRENASEIPSTMTELYNKYMELSLGRWDMEKGLQSQQEYDVIHNVTICIAQFIMDNSLTYISIDEAKRILDEYVDSRNLSIDKDIVLDKILHKQDIFTHNKSKHTICFRHRTFAEYFYAIGLSRDNSALIDESIYDLYWATSYFFYIGLKRDCPEILRAINKIEFSNERYRALKIFSNGTFLLAAYLTPYDIIKESVNSSFKNASELLVDISNTDSDSILKHFPSIHVLCIFTQTMCDTFGYEFFESAVEERAYDICTQPSPSESDYLELFLLNSVLLTIGKKNSYDTMVSNYGKHIPVNIQAGIIEHSSQHDSSSTIVKRLAKKFSKNMKDNNPFRQFVHQLYNEPIKDVKRARITSDCG